MSAQVTQGTLLSTWSDSTLVGSNAFNNTYNEVWGVVVNNIEYAVLGTTFGTHFFDVSDPSDITEVYRVAGKTQGGAIIHRDFHDYNGFLYGVADEGAQSTLQVMDMSFLPDSVSIVYDSKEFIRRSHNIFIDSSSAIMYSCISDGDNVSFSPLRLFDISDPTQPVIISDFREIGNFRFTQVHDAYVKNDTAYLNCGPGGFIMADFTDPVNPVNIVSLGSSDYPQSGYNHSGWLSEDGETYFMADENHGRDIKVFDMTDLPDIKLLDTIDASASHNFSIPHNQVVAGNYLYSSYYYDGLQVWDIEDPENIIRVMHYPTSTVTPRDNFEGSWGVYPFLPSGIILVSDMQEGLFVLDGIANSVATKSIDTIKNDWTITPNPIADQFGISTDLDLHKYQISLFNENGQIIKVLEPKTQHNVNLPSGVYYLNLSTENISSTKALIIGK